jgi:hypothetical protein
MPFDRKRFARYAVAASALALAFAATWAVLDRTEHRPRWIVVEAPGTAVVGQKFEVRATLDESVEATQISCTLHRANAEKREWGYLASSGPPREAVGGSAHSFVFTVPERAETAYVFALVYLSPTGKWQEGTRAVSTALIPVGMDGPGVRGLRPEKVWIRPYPTAAQSAAWRAAARRERPRPSGWIHPVLSVVLLAAAGLAVMKAVGRRPGAPGDGDKERRVWLAFAAVFALAAFLENSGMAGDVAAWGRRLAREQNFYEIRRPFQKAIMSAVAASALGLLLLFIKAVRKSGSHRLLWWAGIGLAAYLSLSFVSVLSFHAVDRVRGIMWLGVSPVDAARGAAAVVTLAAALLALRRKDGPPAT